MIILCLAFKPVLSPLPQASFRTENIKLIHIASFPRYRLSSYKFSTHLTSHSQPLTKETDLSNINYFPFSKTKRGNEP